ncbi:MAG: hypothetical protein FP824_07235 [Euryarchaeota archaeon]|nr:hypothetical protein [Euryarchaeota archaeon]
MDLPNIERYSSDLGIDVYEIMAPFLPGFCPDFSTFFDISIRELYNNQKDCVLFNKEGITTKLKGDQKNVLGALTELYVAGVFAPYIVEHGSPDLCLEINGIRMEVEITNRRSEKGLIDKDGRDKEWDGEFKNLIDKINKKKKNHPHFIFIAVTERAFEKDPPGLRTNIPKSWITATYATPRERIIESLDNRLNGILVYEYMPLHLMGSESAIADTEVAHSLVDTMKERYKEIYPQNWLNSPLFVLDKIKNGAVPI